MWSNESGCPGDENIHVAHVDSRENTWLILVCSLRFYFKWSTMLQSQLDDVDWKKDEQMKREGEDMLWAGTERRRRDAMTASAVVIREGSRATEQPPLASYGVNRKPWITDDGCYPRHSMSTVNENHQLECHQSNFIRNREPKSNQMKDRYHK